MPKKPTPKKKPREDWTATDYQYRSKKTGLWWNGHVESDLQAARLGFDRETVAQAQRTPTRLDVNEKLVAVYRADVTVDPSPERARSKKSTR